MQNSVVLDILEENRAEEWNVAKKNTNSAVVKNFRDRKKSII